MKQNKSPFKWRHFEPSLILLCVRWYCRYQLSYRDLKEMMRERGLSVDHTTVWGSSLLVRYDGMVRPRGSRSTATPRPTLLSPRCKEGGVLPSGMEVWASKHLNNIVEQDHRRVKQRIYPMLGFKGFGNAAVTISGIEIAQEIGKGQFDIANLTKGMRVRVPRKWEAVISA